MALQSLALEVWGQAVCTSLKKSSTLKFLMKAPWSPFLFPQHFIPVHLNEPGVDIALARERAIGSTGAGPEPDPCRSPGAERNSGTFLDGRCPPVSFLQAVPQGCAEPGPRLALPPAVGWCRPHCKDTDVASAHRQAWGVQSHISDFYGCTNQQKKQL